MVDRNTSATYREIRGPEPHGTRYLTSSSHLSLRNVACASRFLLERANMPRAPRASAAGIGFRRFPPTLFESRRAVMRLLSGHRTDPTSRKRAIARQRRQRKINRDGRPRHGRASRGARDGLSVSPDHAVDSWNRWTCTCAPNSRGKVKNMSRAQKCKTRLWGLG